MAIARKVQEVMDKHAVGMLNQKISEEDRAAHVKEFAKLANDDSSTARQLAANDASLDDLHAQSAAGFAWKTEFVPPIIKALEDPSELVQQAAAEALEPIIRLKRCGRGVFSDAVAPLGRALDKDKEALQVAAVKALGGIGTAATLKPLIGAMQTENPVSVRKAAMEYVASPFFPDPSEEAMALLEETLASVQKVMKDTEDASLQASAMDTKEFLEMVQEEANEA